MYILKYDQFFDEKMDLSALAIIDLEKFPTPYPLLACDSGGRHQKISFSVSEKCPKNLLRFYFI